MMILLKPVNRPWLRPLMKTSTMSVEAPVCVPTGTTRMASPAKEAPMTRPTFDELGFLTTDATTTVLLVVVKVPSWLMVTVTVLGAVSRVGVAAEDREGIRRENARPEHDGAGAGGGEVAPVDRGEVVVAGWLL